MKSCNIAHQIIETVSGNSSCCIKIQSVKAFHYICMIRNLKIGNNRLSEFFDLYIACIILSYRNRGINDIGDNHHDLCDLFLEFFFHRLKLCKSLCKFCHFLLYSLCLFFLSLSHKSSDFLGDLVSLISQIIGFCFCCS